MSTVDELERETPELPPPPGRGDLFVGTARRAWRWLTSMRTALILLFLLALAAIPGSLLPQRNLNIDKVTRYYLAHPKLAPILDRLSAFAVFSSPWFSAIYLLLFVSLVGCLVPRLRGHLIAVFRVPPDAPARLERMPAHAGDLSFDGDPGRSAEKLRAMLRRHRFRAIVRERPDGGFTVSAEKGFLKEAGNLLFHFSLMALLLGVAFGSWYGYHADRIVVQGPDQAFCNTLQQYDNYGLGARVNPADLEPFCLELTRFTANYLASGEPSNFRADVSYTIGSGAARSTSIKVNDPLRLAKARIYLIQHGYAPIVRYTDRYGHSQTTVAPYLPTDELWTSTGVDSFPDANVGPDGRDPNDKQQIAFTGVYVPTAANGVATSAFPAENNPVLVLTPYRGDLGLDAGVPSSVYSLDQKQLSSGRLKQVGDPIRLRPGETRTLDDGTKVQFVGALPWTDFSVRYDPGEDVVLAGAILLLVGLLTSLTGKRRRIWFVINPDGTASAGALARSEYAGFAEEFDALVREGTS